MLRSRGKVRSGNFAFSCRPLETKVRWAVDGRASRRLGRRSRESRAGARTLTWRSDSRPSGVVVKEEFQTPVGGC